ncbi:MAG: hypothetical protein ACYC2K_02305 [Gemmatimonadales bacterium]
MNGPPENTPFMVAAYLATAVIIVGYAVLLIRRGRRGDTED